MDYSEIAKWVGWPPIVIALLALGGIGIWIYESRLKLKDEKFNILEQKLKESENLTSDVLIKKYKEIREDLKIQIADASSQSEQDTKKNRELQEKLDEVNSQLDSQREIISRAQQFLTDMELPREGRFREDISSDIISTIKQQKCIYIPLNIRNTTEEILANVKEHHPYKLEVVFPGMFKMYLVFHDCMDNVIGFVDNPYTGIYYKDYFVTLLYYLNLVPQKHLQDAHAESGYPTYEGEANILTDAIYHDISPIDSSIFYIKVPFDETMLEAKG